MKMYGDNEEYRDQLNEAKKQWLTANNQYKKLLQERTVVLFLVAMLTQIAWKIALNFLPHRFQPFRERNFIVISCMMIWTLKTHVS